MEFLAYCQDLVDRMRRLRWDQTGNHRRPFGALNSRPPQSGKNREKFNFSADVVTIKDLKKIRETDAGQTQRPRIDLDKRFLPRPNTTTA